MPVFLLTLHYPGARELVVSPLTMLVAYRLAVPTPCASTCRPNSPPSPPSSSRKHGGRPPASGLVSGMGKDRGQPEGLDRQVERQCAQSYERTV